MAKLQSTDILPLHDESWLHREQITRGDIVKLLPHPDLFGASKEVRREITRLARHGQVIRYMDYTFPLVKRGYALRNPEIEIDQQQKLEALRSLRQGSWRCVPGLVERVELRILSS